jgi:hypothetical protein
MDFVIPYLRGYKYKCIKYEVHIYNIIQEHSEGVANKR